MPSECLCKRGWKAAAHLHTRHTKLTASGYEDQDHVIRHATCKPLIIGLHHRHTFGEMAMNSSAMGSNHPQREAPEGMSEQ